MRLLGVRLPKLRTTAWVGQADLSTLASIAILAFSVSTTARAEVASTDPTTASQFNTTSVLPPSFMSGAQTGLEGIFGACGTIRLENMIDPETGELTAMDALPAALLQTPCPASGGKGPDASDLSCRDYSKAKFDVLAVQVQSSLEGMQCRARKMRAVESEISCLNQQASVLAGKVKSVEKAYVDNIQKMQKDVSTLKNTVTDIEAQMQKVNAKLHGEEATGKPGLLALKEKTLEMIDQLQNDAQVIEEEQRQVTRQRQSLEEQAQFRTMALTMECFKDTKVAKYRATPNGPPVSAYDYVVARYYQNQHIVGKDGRIEDSENVRADALKAKQALETVLQEMIAGAPDSSKMPTTLEEVQTAMNRAVSIEDMDDLESYAGKLAQFNGKGLDIQKFVLSALNQCNKRAATTVKREKKRENSVLGKNAKEILRLERETAKKARQFHTRYMEQIRKDMRGLYTEGPVPPLEFPQCAGFGKLQPHESRAPCFEAIQNGLQELMKGSTTWAEVPMKIQGTNPQTAVRFTCRGLDLCISELQRLSEDRKQQHASAIAFKDQYILAANQNVERFTKEVATTMSVESQRLHARIQALNTAMASLGLGGGIAPSPMRTEQLEKNEDGLYNSPENVLALIGSQMSPPMLDLSRDPFQDALAGLSEGKKDLGKDIGELQRANSLIASLSKSCPLEKVREQIADLESNLDIEECRNYHQVCQTNGPLDELVDAIQAWSLTEGMELEEYSQINSILSNGMESVMCTSNALTKDQLAQRRELAQKSGNVSQIQAADAEFRKAESCERIAQNRTREAERIGRKLGNLDSAADGAL